MARSKVEQTARQNQVRVVKNDQGTRSGPSILIDEPSRATKREATVHFDLTINGGWILRAYSNESTIERLKLERISKAAQQQINANETTSPMGPSTTLINGVLSKAPINQPVTGNPRCWIRLDDGIWRDPRLAQDDNPSELYMIEPRTASHFKGTATSGYNKPFPGEAGKWYFQTVGDDEGYSEGAAAMNMGGQGIFKPERDRPTAQDVAEYRKCLKAWGNGTEGVSDGIVIVWRPDSWSPPHQQQESNPNDGVGIESLRSQDQVDKPEDEINQSSGNRASSADRSPLRGRSPSPSRFPVPDHDEVVESMEVDEQDDPRKLMPPPALPPATPLEQRKNKSRRSLASAISSQSGSRRFEREDTPLPESDRKKRKRKSSEAESRSSQKARKITQSVTTVDSDEKARKNWSTLRVFEDSLRKSSSDKGSAKEAEKEVEKDDVDEGDEEEDLE